MGRTKRCLFIILLTIILQLKSTIAITPKGFTLRMIHKDSEESPFYNPLDPLMTPEERFQSLVNQSGARARYIASQINPDVYARVVYEETYNYAANVGIGTFRGKPGGYMSYYLLVDSGSDYTWLQCQGARQTFPQDQDLYPWKDSESYHPIPCQNHSPRCQRCNEKRQCVYNVSYASSQVTSGVFALEKFTLKSRTGDTESFQIIMGCGFRQENFTFGNGSRNLIAGILGLGRGKPSFVTQYRPGEGKFSYCFEEYRGRMVGNTDLSFGADATIQGQAIRTPIVRTSFQTPYYYLNLEGISVGGAIVPIPRSEFQINHGQTGGCIIDSGAPLTTMYRDFFDKVAETVDLYFKRFGMDRAGFPVVHACYAPKDGIEYTVPTITFHFQQAKYVVSEAQTWFAIEGKICLAITRSDSKSPAVILGAYQQINKRILYNIPEMSLSFADEDCGRGPRG